MKTERGIYKTKTKETEPTGIVKQREEKREGVQVKAKANTNTNKGFIDA